MSDKSKIHEAYHVFLAADERWSELLRQQFGKQAGDIRYLPAGKGEDGSELRSVHDAFIAAGNEWRRLM